MLARRPRFRRAMFSVEARGAKPEAGFVVNAGPLSIGMNYLVITTTHHEGFGLWDSQCTDFDVATTPFKDRDILDELRQAYEKYGIQFGMPYSIINWNHPS